MFWCCYVEGTIGYSRKHLDIGEASSEAQRLAILSENVGKKVYILQAIEYYVVEIAPMVRHIL